MTPGRAAAYRRAWQWAAAVVLGLGWGVLGVVAILAAPWTCAVALTIGVVVGRRLERSEPRALARLAASPFGVGPTLAALVLPLAVIAGIGLQLLLGPVGLALLAVVAVAGLPVLLPQRVPLHVDLLVPGPAPRRRAGAVVSGGFPSPVDDLESWSSPEVVPEGDATSRLSTAELCHAWRASYRALMLCAGTGPHARIAAARAVYLDALQARDPAGFARWLAADPTGVADPRPFFAADP